MYTHRFFYDTMVCATVTVFVKLKRNSHQYLSSVYLQSRFLRESHLILVLLYTNSVFAIFQTHRIFDLFSNTVTLCEVNRSTVVRHTPHPPSNHGICRCASTSAL